VTETTPPAPAAPRRLLDRFAIGILAHPLLLAAFLAAASSLGARNPLLLFAIGAVQFAFVVPVALAAWALGLRQFVKGFALAAGVVILLNAGCWGLVWGVSGGFR
jgi:hypothetical protein